MAGQLVYFYKNTKGNLRITGTPASAMNIEQCQAAEILSITNISDVPLRVRMGGK